MQAIVWTYNILRNQGSSYLGLQAIEKKKKVILGYCAKLSDNILLLDLLSHEMWKCLGYTSLSK